MRRFFSRLLIGCVLILTACGQSNQVAEPVTSPDGVAVIATDSKMIDSAQSGQLRPGDTSPDFSYTLPDGTTHKLSDLHGKKVLVNFWATWCGPCQGEMPELQSASKAFAADGLVIVAVNREQTPDVIAPFATKFGITFPIITDTSDAIGNGFGVRGLPTSYFVNTDGSVSFRQLGAVTQDFIKLRLQEMH